MLIQKLREVFGRNGKHEHDAADELQFHLEKETRSLRASISQGRIHWDRSSANRSLPGLVTPRPQVIRS